MPLAESRSYGFADVGRASMPARNVLISVSVLVVTSSASVVAQELAVGIFGGSFLDNTKICHAASFEKATGAKVDFVLGNSVQNAASCARHVAGPTSMLHISTCRSEERRVGKECRSRWSP